MNEKQYIGDGVYVRSNGYYVIAETKGNTIYFEDGVLVEMVRYAMKMGLITPASVAEIKAPQKHMVILLTSGAVTDWLTLNEEDALREMEDHTGVKPEYHETLKFYHSVSGDENHEAYALPI